MPRMNPSPFGHGGPRRGVEYPEALVDEYPRSHPEDRQEGNLDPDPTLECWTCVPADTGRAEPNGRPMRAAHGPSGEPADDDGAGNPSPRVEETRYGQDDADQGDLGAT